MMFESSSKSRKSWTDDYFGSGFRIFEATDENDLEAAMMVLLEGTHIDKDEEERRARVGTYRGIRDASKQF